METPFIQMTMTPCSKGSKIPLILLLVACSISAVTSTASDHSVPKDKVPINSLSESPKSFKDDFNDDVFKPSSRRESSLPVSEDFVERSTFKREVGAPKDGDGGHAPNTPRGNFTGITIKHAATTGGKWVLGIPASAQEKVLKGFATDSHGVSTMRNSSLKISTENIPSLSTENISILTGMKDSQNRVRKARRVPLLPGTLGPEPYFLSDEESSQRFDKGKKPSKRREESFSHFKIFPNGSPGKTKMKGRHSTAKPQAVAFIVTPDSFSALLDHQDPKSSSDLRRLHKNIRSLSASGNKNLRSNTDIVRMKGEKISLEGLLTNSHTGRFPGGSGSDRRKVDFQYNLKNYLPGAVSTTTLSPFLKMLDVPLKSLNSERGKDVVELSKVLKLLEISSKGNLKKKNRGRTKAKKISRKDNLDEFNIARLKDSNSNRGRTVSRGGRTDSFEDKKRKKYDSSESRRENKNHSSFSRRKEDSFEIRRAKDRKSRRENSLKSHRKGDDVREIKQKHENYDSSDFRRNKDQFSSRQIGDNSSEFKRRRSDSSEYKKLRDYSSENKRTRHDSYEYKETEDDSSERRRKDDYDSEEDKRSKHRKNNKQLKDRRNKKYDSSELRNNKQYDSSQFRRNRDYDFPSPKRKGLSGSRRDDFSDSRERKNYDSSDSRERKDYDSSDSRERKEYDSSDSREKKDYDSSRSRERDYSREEDSLEFRKDKDFTNSRRAKHRDRSDISKSDEYFPSEFRSLDYEPNEFSKNKKYDSSEPKRGKYFDSSEFRRNGEDSHSSREFNEFSERKRHRDGSFEFHRKDDSHESSDKDFYDFRFSDDYDSSEFDHKERKLDSFQDEFDDYSGRDLPPLNFASLLQGSEQENSGKKLKKKRPDILDDIQGDLLSFIAGSEGLPNDVRHAFGNFDNPDYREFVAKLNENPSFLSSFGLTYVDPSELPFFQEKKKSGKKEGKLSLFETLFNLKEPKKEKKKDILNLELFSKNFRRKNSKAPKEKDLGIGRGSSKKSLADLLSSYKLNSKPDNDNEKKKFVKILGENKLGRKFGSEDKGILVNDAMATSRPKTFNGVTESNREKSDGSFTLTPKRIPSAVVATTPANSFPFGTTVVTSTPASRTGPVSTSGKKGGKVPNISKFPIPPFDSNGRAPVFINSTVIYATTPSTPYLSPVDFVPRIRALSQLVPNAPGIYYHVIPPGHTHSLRGLSNSDHAHLPGNIGNIHGIGQGINTVSNKGLSGVSNPLKRPHNLNSLGLHQPTTTNQPILTTQHSRNPTTPRPVTPFTTTSRNPFPPTPRRTSIHSTPFPTTRIPTTPFHTSSHPTKLFPTTPRPSSLGHPTTPFPSSRSTTPFPTTHNPTTPFLNTHNPITTVSFPQRSTTQFTEEPELTTPSRVTTPFSASPYPRTIKSGTLRPKLNQQQVRTTPLQRPNHPTNIPFVTRQPTTPLQRPNHPTNIPFVTRQPTTPLQRPNHPTNIPFVTRQPTTPLQRPNHPTNIPFVTRQPTTPLQRPNHPTNIPFVTRQPTTPFFRNHGQTPPFTVREIPGKLSQNNIQNNPFSGALPNHNFRRPKTLPLVTSEAPVHSVQDQNSDQQPVEKQKSSSRGRRLRKKKQRKNHVSHSIENNFSQPRTASSSTTTTTTPHPVRLRTIPPNFVVRRVRKKGRRKKLRRQRGGLKRNNNGRTIELGSRLGTPSTDPHLHSKNQDFNIHSNFQKPNLSKTKPFITETFTRNSKEKSLVSLRSNQHGSRNSNEPVTSAPLDSNLRNFQTFVTTPVPRSERLTFRPRHKNLALTKPSFSTIGPVAPIQKPRKVTPFPTINKITAMPGVKRPTPSPITFLTTTAQPFLGPTFVTPIPNLRRPLFPIGSPIPRVQNKVLNPNAFPRLVSIIEPSLRNSPSSLISSGTPVPKKKKLSRVISSKELKKSLKKLAQKRKKGKFSSPKVASREPYIQKPPNVPLAVHPFPPNVTIKPRSRQLVLTSPVPELSKATSPAFSKEASTPQSAKGKPTPVSIKLQNDPRKPQVTPFPGAVNRIPIPEGVHISSRLRNSLLSGRIPGIPATYALRRHPHAETELNLPTLKNGSPIHKPRTPENVRLHTRHQLRNMIQNVPIPKLPLGTSAYRSPYGPVLVDPRTYSVPISYLSASRPLSPGLSIKHLGSPVAPVHNLPHIISPHLSNGSPAPYYASNSVSLPDGRRISVPFGLPSDGPTLRNYYVKKSFRGDPTT